MHCLGAFLLWLVILICSILGDENTVLLLIKLWEWGEGEKGKEESSVAPSFQPDERIYEQRLALEVYPRAQELRAVTRYIFDSFWVSSSKSSDEQRTERMGLVWKRSNKYWYLFHTFISIKSLNFRKITWHHSLDSNIPKAAYGKVNKTSTPHLSLKGHLPGTHTHKPLPA